MKKEPGPQDGEELAVRSISVLFSGTHKPSPSVFLAVCSHQPGDDAKGLGQDLLTEGHSFQKEKKKE